MKIALCLEYPIQLRGGVSVLVETLLRELARRGHQTVLVSPDRPDSLQQGEVGDILWKHVPWEPQHRPSISNAKELARKLKDLKIEIAHFHAGGNYGWGNRFPFYSPVYYLNRGGIPCVQTVHSVTSILRGYCGELKPTWFRSLLFPLGWLGKMQQLRHVRREIAVSQHDLRKLQRWYRPYHNRFVQIYHSRLAVEAMPRTPTKRAPLILNVGHLARRKGQVILAEAFARIAGRHPDWRLAFAGHSSTDGVTEQIERVTSEAGLHDRIQLLGQRDDAMELMKLASIYVQPSLEEALGLALQEAMYFGCPSIGSRVGGIPELIENGRTGILVSTGNSAHLAEALEKLINDGSLRDQMGAAGAASIVNRGMTVTGMVERHLELYDKVAI